MEGVVDIGALVQAARLHGIFVFGTGITGQAVSQRFREAGIEVSALDQRGLPEQVSRELENIGVRLLSPVDQLTLDPVIVSKKPAFCVVSPGIEPGGSLLAHLEANGVPLVSETDLVTYFCGMPRVAVTGTNGKSTTVSLIHAMLTRSGRGVSLVGNIGRAFVEMLSAEQLEKGGPRKDIEFVAELSSYQLEWSRRIVPYVSVWLNLSENHLERHKSIERYREAKKRIFINQSNADWAILNQEDPHYRAMRDGIPARVATFGVGELSVGALLNEGNRTVSLLGVTAREESYSLVETKLIGRHNRLNLAAAILASRIAGAEPAAIQQTINSFAPLEHRLEFVRELNGVTFINDSKATTVASATAVMNALCAEYPESKLVVLVGGLAKQGNWQEFSEVLWRGVSCVIGFGKDGAKVVDEIKAKTTAQLEYFVEPEMCGAVKRAATFAAPGEIVVLAPACASFDRYPSFEERGKHFKELVLKL